MAYDKIRVIHTRLDYSLRYVMNAEKTVDGATGAVLVGGINCQPDTAYRIKRQSSYGKRLFEVICHDRFQSRLLSRTS